ncbi:MAG: glycosyltransferase family 39 protein, partial [Chthoniobacterales bacterium]
MNSLLAHAASAIFGERPWTVRLPSVVFGIAGVWAFYFVARQIWQRGVALSGTFLFAVSYHHIYYTQMAR